jgi:hypothetical protein
LRAGPFRQPSTESARRSLKEHGSMLIKTMHIKNQHIEPIFF